MRVRTQIQLFISVAFLIVLAMSIIYWLNQAKLDDIAVVEERSQAAASKIASLQSLTHEYFIHPEARVAQQWLSQHTALTDLLQGSSSGHLPKAPVDLVKVNELADLFQRLKVAGSNDSSFNVRQKDFLTQQLVVTTEIVSDATREWERNVQKSRISLEREFKTLTLVIPFLMLVILLLLGFLLYHRVLIPLNVLHNAVGTVSKGDLSVRSNYRRKDELGDLSLSFNLMAENLSKTMATKDEYFKEIEQRKRAEEELIKSRQLLAETGKISKVGGWEFNIDTGQQKWTEEVYHIHEVGLDFDPNVKAGIDFYSEASKPVIAEAVQRAIEHGEPFDLELEIITAKGNLRSVHAIGTAELKHHRVRGIFQDITDQKKAEEERENLIANLQDKTAEQERFVYTVSHDLKNPLVTISGFAEIVERDLLSGNQEDAKEHLSEISKAAQHMSQLLDDLLEISRVGAKKNPEEIVNFNKLISQATDNLSGVINELKTTFEVESELPDVMVDKQRFLQVFENLIVNAIRYSSEAKGGSIVKIGVIRGDGELTCYVKDNGIGIEPAYLEKIFGLFERLDTGTIGTGVGLAIVKRIIENHGGRIWAESEGLGHGTTFFFTLPEAKQ